MTAPTTRTDGIDFAAILQAWETFIADDGHPALRARTGQDLLAIKVPELCPESGSHDDHGLIPSLGCDLCPTIGQMLREWQALTAIAEYATHHDWNCPRPGRADCACGLDAARAALEAVRGD